MELFPEPEDVKRLRSFYDAVAQGDFNAARHYLDPTFEWNEPEAPGLWFAGTHHGPDAVFREVIEPTYGRIAQFELKMRKFYQIGDTVIAIGHARGRTKMTGRDLDAPVAHIWTLRNGKAVQLQAYEDVPKWLDAVEEKPQVPQQMAA